MMGFQDAFAILNKGQNSITSIKGLIASEFPKTLKALKIIDQDCASDKRRKGFSLEKVESKKLGFVYYARYSWQGRKIKFNTRTNIPEEAEKFALENKERLIEQYVRSHDARMYEILGQFYKPNSEYLLCEEKRNHTISELCRKDYHAIVANKFVPFLRARNVKSFNEVTPNLLSDYQDFLLKGKVKPQTVNNNYKALKRIFKYIFRKGIIKANSCESVHYIPVHKEDQAVRGCHELDKLKNVFDRKWKDELSYMLCLLIYTTGMRNSEITKVAMDDIIKIGACNFVDIKESKTSSGIRQVPLHEFTYKKIYEYWHKNRIKGALFAGCRPEAFSKANEELAKKLKIDGGELKKENITFYSGRHFWKTMMNVGGLGEDIEEVFMGHMVSSDVAKLYNHRDKQGKGRIIAKAKQVYKILDHYIFGCKGKNKKAPA